jgi:ParB family chromosome partitioning protein
MWDLHDRLEEHITEDSCRAELASFSESGQLVPALARPILADPMYDYELIYGARRLFIARHLNLPITIEVREMSDREAIIALDIENRHRLDVSPYERGRSYAKWLHLAQFETQETMARALKVSPAQVSRLLKLARLPSVIVAAFTNPLQIREVWGIELYERWQDPQCRHAMAQTARQIRQLKPRPAASQVYEQLAGNVHAGRRAARGALDARRDEVVHDSRGAPLFRVRFQRRNVALLIPAKRLPLKSLKQLKINLAGLLQLETAQRADSSSSSTELAWIGQSTREEQPQSAHSPHHCLPIPILSKNSNDTAGNAAAGCPATHSDGALDILGDNVPTVLTYSPTVDDVRRLGEPSSVGCGARQNQSGFARQK